MALRRGLYWAERGVGAAWPASHPTIARTPLRSPRRWHRSAVVRLTRSLASVDIHARRQMPRWRMRIRIGDANGSILDGSGGGLPAAERTLASGHRAGRLPDLLHRLLMYNVVYELARVLGRDRMVEIFFGRPG